MDHLQINGPEIGSSAAAVAVLRSEASRIYVACLAAYNNGILHGKWIPASTDTDEIWAEVSAMLKASPIPRRRNGPFMIMRDLDQLTLKNIPLLTMFRALQNSSSFAGKC